MTAEIEANQPKNTKPKDPKVTLFKIVLQTIFVYQLFCFGMISEIINSTLPAIKDRLGVEYEDMTFILLACEAGLLIGSIVAGLLLDRLHKQVIILCGFACVFAAVFIALVPWIEQLWLVSLVYGGAGFMGGFLCTGISSRMLEMFGSKGGTAVHLYQFGFSSGAISTSLLARAFLSNDVESVSSNVTVPTPSDTASEYSLEIAYGIIGCAMFMCALALVITHIYTRCKPDEGTTKRVTIPFKEAASMKTCSNGHICFGFKAFVAIFFYFFLAIGGERAFNKYLPAYAVETEVDFSMKDAPMLTTAYWSTVAVIRIICAVATAVISVDILIGLQCVLVLISSVMLALFGHYNATVLWVCSVLNGVGIGAAFPNGVAWANQHLYINNVAFMFIMIAASLGGLAHQYAVGIFFDESPEYLGYVMIVHAGISTLVFIYMKLITCMRRRNDIDDGTMKTAL